MKACPAINSLVHPDHIFISWQSNVSCRNRLIVINNWNLNLATKKKLKRKRFGPN